MATIPVENTELPSGFCPTDYQNLLNVFTQHQFVTLDAITGVQVSTATPTDQTLPWLQLDGSGKPVRLYWFADGAWLALHTLEPGMTLWWFRVIPNFDVFDGGSAGVVTATSGPMWQPAKLPDGTVIAAQFPLVAGTTAPPTSTVLSLGDTGGEELHTLTSPEAAINHQHVFGRMTQIDSNDDFALTTSTSSEPYMGASGLLANRIDGDSGGGANPQIQLSDGILNGRYATTSPSYGFGTIVGHNNMPPFAVGYLLQRTARQFFRIAP